MSEPAHSFYVTGGTLRHDAACYVERQADRDLLEGLLQGEFCYVLTSRQMGKSSLMVRTATRLRAQQVNVVVLDLTAIGQNLTPEQWYNGLMARIGQQLRLEDELEDFWLANDQLSPVQRLFMVLREVAMPKRPGPLVLFVDEIDAVHSLPFSTDEFFAAIRECYNRRAEDAEFKRLTFGLLGVATPSDLIRDTRTTPFNIGRRIELTDFNEAEAAPLLQGLGRDPTTARALLQRMLYWTNGHPYLTQRLCQFIAGESTVNRAAEVDRICEDLFLSSRAREKDDNLIFVRDRILRSEADRTSLLSLYEDVRRRKPVPDDETNPLVSILRLSGIVRAKEGLLWLRNRIYHQVFDHEWVLTNLPDAELRRQRAAFRTGLWRSIGVAAVLLTFVAAVLWHVLGKQEASRRDLAVKNLGAVYNGLTSYQDRAVYRGEERAQGSKMTWENTGALIFVKPNKFRFHIQEGSFKEEIVCDGKTIWFYRSAVKQYASRPAPKSFLVPESKGGTNDPLLASVAEAFNNFALYAIICSDNPQKQAAQWITNLQFFCREKLEGQSVYVLTGKCPVELPVDKTKGKTNAVAKTVFLPAKIWVDQKDGHARQLMVDMSSHPSRRNTLITETHRDIRLNVPIPESQFAFIPPSDARKVEAWGRVAFEPYPPRDPRAKPSQIDLSLHYNTTLTTSWLTDSGVNTGQAAIPSGLQTLGGIQFDVRGIVQLANEVTRRKLPERINDIKVGANCQRLHFLQAMREGTTNGVEVGHYVVHYVNGQEQAISIRFGSNTLGFRPRLTDPVQASDATVVWRGTNLSSSAGSTNDNNTAGWRQLLKYTWNNPIPAVEISSLDLVSAPAKSLPFLVALTVEPPPKFNRAALAKLIPPRDAQASSNLIDLSPHYNVPWPHVQASRLEKTLLPCGLHFLDGVSFDVRGVIQLANQDNLEDYPVEVKGINVGLKCRRLAFLHATRLEATYNTRIGAFLIHYADGQDQAIPINYARNVLNCWRGSTDLTEIPGATVAWRGTNEVAQAGTAPWLQLYKMAWENPRPDQVIQSLDYQSTRSTCKPFLIAITVEP